MSCLQLFILVFLSSSLKGETKHEDSQLEQHVYSNSSNHLADLCPTWYTPNNRSGEVWCVCDDKTVQGGTIVRCPIKNRICLTCEWEKQVSGGDNLNVSIPSGFCMSYNSSTNQTLLAHCPYNDQVNGTYDFFVTLPSDLRELNSYMCDNRNRRGDICESCRGNTRLAVFGLHGKCIAPENTAHTWLYFLSTELFLPILTFAIILFCRVQATSGPLNAFIFLCQTLMTISLKITASGFGVKDKDYWNSTLDAVQSCFIGSVATFYGFWNNQYIFFSIHTLSAEMSPIQSIAIQYLPALYPLVLVVISWVIIKLHYNGCRILVYMWSPFQYCKLKLGIEWDPMKSVVHTFATFILLTYTKILVVSYQILTPSRIYNQTGELPYKIVSFDASVHFLSHEHLPYVVLAVSMLTIFCGLPVLVLLLYPMACFQKLLNKTASPHTRQLLRIFTEAYVGCYKDKTMPHQNVDCRYFAALYFLFRVFYLAGLFFVEYCYMWLAITLIPLIISSLFAIIQPYKKNWLNVVDSVAFALVTIVTMMYAYDIYIAKVPLWVPNSICLLPFLYFVVFVSYKIFIKIKYCWTKCRKKIVRMEHWVDEEQSMFERERERLVENSPLISPI